MKSRLEPSCRLSGGLQSLHPGARRWLWRPDLEVETSNLATIFLFDTLGLPRMLNLLLENTSAKFLDNSALIFEGKNFTYADLSGLTQRLAVSLQRRGINAGDRIAFLLPNCLEIVLCYYACFKIGAIAVPLNVRFGSGLLKHVINHSGARVLISEPDLFAQFEQIRSSLPGVELYFLTSGHSQFQGVKPFDELLTPTSAPNTWPTLNADCAAAIYYTSGTTGLPKAVIHSHASLERATQIQIDQLAISSDDRTVIMFPVCYLIGFGSQILPFHTSGAACVLQPYFGFKQVFGVEITEGCGMTELQIYSLNPPFGQKKAGSIGKPVACMEVSLVDNSGCPIAKTGEVGEMIVRGGIMTTGYWRDPELTARNIRNGWFHTGDLPRLVRVHR